MPEPLHYHIDVFYSEDHGGWIAAVPDLQNANASGDTPGKALRERSVVMQIWTESWLENHDAPPPARYRPIELSQAG